jgi:hypothetical protein
VGVRLNTLIDQIRSAKGPFFVARIGLRVKFSLNNTDLPDSDAYEKQLLEASRALGFDPLDPALTPKKNTT